MKNWQVTQQWLIFFAGSSVFTDQTLGCPKKICCQFYTGPLKPKIRLFHKMLKYKVSKTKCYLKIFLSGQVFYHITNATQINHLIQCILYVGTIKWKRGKKTKIKINTEQITIITSFCSLFSYGAFVSFISFFFHIQLYFWLHNIYKWK